MADYKIYVLDEDGDRIETVSDYIRAEFRLRYNAVGQWRVELPNSTRAGSAFAYRGGVELTRDGTSVFTGAVTEIRRARRADKDVLTVKGNDDLDFINIRLAYNVPENLPYSTREYDVQTGAAETVIKHYVDYNVGDNALSARQISGLSVEADEARGGTVTGRARFDNLLEVIQGLALQGGDIGFRVVGREFQVYEPSDKTATVIFSDGYGSLGDFDYYTQRSAANYIIAGGSAEGTARNFYEGGSTDSITAYRRIEDFIDKRSGSADVIAADITERLAKDAERVSLRINPRVDLPDMQFYTKWYLGDRVKAIIDDITIEDIIREVVITIDVNGEVIEPVISTPQDQSNDVLGQIISNYNRLNNRLGLLERR